MNPNTSTVYLIGGPADGQKLALPYPPERMPRQYDVAMHEIRDLKFPVPDSTSEKPVAIQRVTYYLGWVRVHNEGIVFVGVTEGEPADGRFMSILLEHYSRTRGNRSR